MNRLQNKIAIITGAAQGIGAAIAREFLQEGAIVLAIDLNRYNLEKFTQRLTQTWEGKIFPFAFDITDYFTYEKFVQEIVARYKTIDVLVNNAGIEYYEDIFNDTFEHWTRTLRVNLEAIYWGSRLVASQMSKQKRGWIINMSSTQALQTWGWAGPYTASKGGIISFTRAMAVDLAPYNILVNAIAPGCIHTPMSIVNGVDETTTEDFVTWYVKKRKIPLARAGKPEEIAKVAVFLASEECSYITGQTLVVDGGLTITF